MFPATYSATALFSTKALSPNCFAQIKLPVESNLKIKPSFSPTEVRLNIPVPGSKSTVPSK